jgi:hypothetical protein
MHACWWLCACISAYIRMYVYVCVYVCMHIHTYTHTYTVTLPTISLCTTNRVSVLLAFLRVCACSQCNSFCSIFVSVHLCSLVHSLLFQLYEFVSFYTQLRLILFIYWSSPLLFDKILISHMISVTHACNAIHAFMHTHACINTYIHICNISYHISLGKYIHAVVSHTFHCRLQNDRKKSIEIAYQLSFQPPRKIVRFCSRPESRANAGMVCVFGMHDHHA